VETWSLREKDVRDRLWRHESDQKENGRLKLFRFVCATLTGNCQVQKKNEIELVNQK